MDGYDGHCLTSPANFIYRREWSRSSVFFLIVYFPLYSFPPIEPFVTIQRYARITNVQPLTALWPMPDT